MPTAIEAARLLEPLRPRWLEEPVRWADDRRELKLLAQRTRIPLSAGESELTSYGCRACIEDQAIQILQFDCTMMGGFTEGRKLAALCELNHVQVAPHHDCFIHAHIVAGSPAGCIVESFTDPERDPLQAELFEDPPKIANGMLTLKEEPGLGLTLSEAALKKFGEKILSEPLTPAGSEYPSAGSPCICVWRLGGSLALANPTALDLPVAVCVQFVVDQRLQLLVTEARQRPAVDEVPRASG